MTLIPGLAPLDWFVGIVGAVGFRLLIYCKAKKAKKFRRDAEYGTARWGNEKDIKPFIELVDVAKARPEVRQVELEFIEGNSRAQALYEKVGFRVVGGRPNAFALKDGAMKKAYLMQLKKYRSGLPGYEVVQDRYTLLLLRSFHL